MALRSHASVIRRRFASSHRRRGIAIASVVLATTACAGDAAVAPRPTTNVSQMFWALTLDHHAVTLSTVAPYDTIRLTATPRNVSGEPLTGLSAPTFTSLDLQHAQVDSTGLVHARKAGATVLVVVRLADGNLVHVDTAVIKVTNVAVPPVLASLSIHPDSGDSAKTAVDVYRALATRALAADSTQISGLSVYYTSSDPTTATIDRRTGLVQPIRPGHVTLIAEATAYGITRADTLRFAIGYPSLGLVRIEQLTNADGQVVTVFVPDRFTVGPGADFVFWNRINLAADVVFDDPTNVVQSDTYCAVAPQLCGVGNVGAFSAALDSAQAILFLPGLRARHITVPGTYTYHSTLLGATGTIIVANEPADIP